MSHKEQVSHVDDPTRLNVPSGHGLQTDEPSDSANVPAGLLIQ